MAGSNDIVIKLEVQGNTSSADAALKSLNETLTSTSRRLGTLSKQMVDFGAASELMKGTGLGKATTSLNKLIKSLEDFGAALELMDRKAISSLTRMAKAFAAVDDAAASSAGSIARSAKRGADAQSAAASQTAAAGASEVQTARKVASAWKQTRDEIKIAARDQAAGEVGSGALDPKLETGKRKLIEATLLQKAATEQLTAAEERLAHADTEANKALVQQAETRLRDFTSLAAQLDQQLARRQQDLANAQAKMLSSGASATFGPGRQAARDAARQAAAEKAERLAAERIEAQRLRNEYTLSDVQASRGAGVFGPELAGPTRARIKAYGDLQIAARQMAEAVARANQSTEESDKVAAETATALWQKAAAAYEEAAAKQVAAAQKIVRAEEQVNQKTTQTLANTKVRAFIDEMGAFDIAGGRMASRLFYLRDAWRSLSETIGGGGALGFLAQGVLLTAGTHALGASITQGEQEQDADARLRAALGPKRYAQYQGQINRAADSEAPLGATSAQVKTAVSYGVSAGLTPEQAIGQVHLWTEMAAKLGTTVDAIAKRATQPGIGMSRLLKDLGITVMAPQATQMSKGATFQQKYEGFSQAVDIQGLRNTKGQSSDPFGGLAEQKAQTFQGQMTHLQTSLDNLFARIGTVILPPLTVVVGKVADLVTGITQLGDRIGPIFAVLAGSGATVGGILLAVFGVKFLKAIQGVWKMFTTVNDVVRSKVTPALRQLADQERDDTLQTEKLGQSIYSLPREWDILINVFADKAMNDKDAFIRNLDLLMSKGDPGSTPGQRTFDAQIGAPGAPEATQQMAAVVAEAQAVAATRAFATVGLNDQVSAKLRQIAGELAQIRTEGGKAVIRVSPQIDQTSIFARVLQAQEQVDTLAVQARSARRSRGGREHLPAIQTRLRGEQARLAALRAQMDTELGIPKDIPILLEPQVDPKAESRVQTKLRALAGAHTAIVKAVDQTTAADERRLRGLEQELSVVSGIKDAHVKVSDEVTAQQEAGLKKVASELGQIQNKTALVGVDFMPKEQLAQAEATLKTLGHDLGAIHSERAVVWVDTSKITKEQRALLDALGQDLQTVSRSPGRIGLHVDHLDQVEKLKAALDGIVADEQQLGAMTTPTRVSQTPAAPPTTTTPPPTTTNLSTPQMPQDQQDTLLMTTANQPAERLVYARLIAADGGWATDAAGRKIVQQVKAEMVATDDQVQQRYQEALAAEEAAARRLQDARTHNAPKTVGQAQIALRNAQRDLAQARAALPRIYENVQNAGGDLHITGAQIDATPKMPQDLQGKPLQTTADQPAEQTMQVTPVLGTDEQRAALSQIEGRIRSLRDQLFREGSTGGTKSTRYQQIVKDLAAAEEQYNGVWNRIMGRGPGEEIHLPTIADITSAEPAPGMKEPEIQAKGLLSAQVALDQNVPASGPNGMVAQWSRLKRTMQPALLKAMDATGGALEVGVSFGVAAGVTEAITNPHFLSDIGRLKDAIFAAFQGTPLPSPSDPKYQAALKAVQAQYQKAKGEAQIPVGLKVDGGALDHLLSSSHTTTVHVNAVGSDGKPFTLTDQNGKITVQVQQPQAPGFDFGGVLGGLGSTILSATVFSLTQSFVQGRMQAGRARLEGLFQQRAQDQALEQATGGKEGGADLKATDAQIAQQEQALVPVGPNGQPITQAAAAAAQPAAQTEAEMAALQKQMADLASKPGGTTSQAYKDLATKLSMAEQQAQAQATGGLENFFAQQDASGAAGDASRALITEQQAQAEAARLEEILKLGRYPGGRAITSAERTAIEGRLAGWAQGASDLGADAVDGAAAADGIAAKIMGALPGSFAAAAAQNGVRAALADALGGLFSAAMDTAVASGAIALAPGVLLGAIVAGFGHNTNGTVAPTADMNPNKPPAVGRGQQAEFIETDQAGDQGYWAIVNQYQKNGKLSTQSFRPIKIPFGQTIQQMIGPQKSLYQGIGETIGQWIAQGMQGKSVAQAFGDFVSWSFNTIKDAASGLKNALSNGLDPKSTRATGLSNINQPPSTGKGQQAVWTPTGPLPGQGEWLIIDTHDNKTHDPVYQPNPFNHNKPTKPAHGRGHDLKPGSKPAPVGGYVDGPGGAVLVTPGQRTFGPSGSFGYWPSTASTTPTGQAHIAAIATAAGQHVARTLAQSGHTPAGHRTSAPGAPNRTHPTQQRPITVSIGQITLPQVTNAQSFAQELERLAQGAERAARAA
jgi:hypothetical protein